MTPEEFMEWFFWFLIALVNWIMRLPVVMVLALYYLAPAAVAQEVVTIENHGSLHPIKGLSGDQAPYLLVFVKSGDPADVMVLNASYRGVNGKAMEAISVCRVSDADAQFHVCRMDGVDADGVSPIRVLVVGRRFNQALVAESNQRGNR